MVNISPSICHVILVAGEPIVVQVRLEDEPESDVVEVIPTVLGGTAEKQIAKGMSFINDNTQVFQEALAST